MQIQATQEIIKIRDRGQITLPQELRASFPWLNSGSVVEIEANQAKNQVVIKPLIKKFETVKRRPVKYKQKMTMSWEEIERNFEKIRKAGRKINLTEYLIKERDRRKYEF